MERAGGWTSSPTRFHKSLTSSNLAIAMTIISIDTNRDFWKSKIRFCRLHLVATGVQCGDLKWTLNETIRQLVRHTQHALHTTIAPERNQIFQALQNEFIEELTEMQASWNLYATNAIFAATCCRQCNTECSTKYRFDMESGKCVSKVDTEHVKCINDK